MCTPSAAAPLPFILGEQGNAEEVMASEQEACASHSASTVVFAAVIHCVTQIVCSNCHLLTVRPPLRSMCIDDKRHTGQTEQQSQNHRCQAHNLHTFYVYTPSCCSTITQEMIGAKLEKEIDAKETIGNNVMTPMKIIHKHPDILPAYVLP